MLSSREKILLSLLVSLIAGTVLFIQYQARPSADITLSSTSPIELVVGPDKIWKAGPNNTQMVIGIRGKSGFTGNVTVSLSGLGDQDFFMCDSNCGPAGVAIGRPPYTLTAVAGEWRMFAPGINLYLDRLQDFENHQYTITVTASVDGYPDITKSVQLLAEAEYKEPSSTAQGGGLIMPDTYNLVGLPYCVFTNAMKGKQGNPIVPANKQWITAGQQATYTCHMHAPAGNGHFQNEWQDGTIITYVPVDEYTDSPIASSLIDAWFEPEKVAFDKPDFDVHDQTTGDVTYNEEKNELVALTIQTTEATPSGVYVIGMGMERSSGGWMNMMIDTVLTVAGTSRSISATQESSQQPTQQVVVSPSAQSPTTPVVNNQTTDPSGVASPTAVQSQSLKPAIDDGTISPSSSMTSASPTPSATSSSLPVVTSQKTSSNDVVIPPAVSVSPVPSQSSVSMPVTIDPSRHDPANQLTFDPSQTPAIVFAGDNELPGTEIIIHVFSEEQIFRTTVGPDGKWSLTVDLDTLPAGDHHVELEKAESGEREQILVFTIPSLLQESSPSPSVSTVASNPLQSPRDYRVGWYVIGVMTVLVVTYRVLHDHGIFPHQAAPISPPKPTKPNHRHARTVRRNPRKKLVKKRN